MHADLDQLLAREVADITAVPLDDLRQLRTDCSGAEADVSFVRRVAQGRLDIVGHETRRRTGVVDAEPDVSGLLFDLPDILAAGNGGGSAKRSVAIGAPGRLAQDLLTALDEIASPAQLASLDGLDSATLSGLMDTLGTFEVELSSARRRLHERIDAIQNEIARRYRDGEASIESLLN